MGWQSGQTIPRAEQRSHTPAFVSLGRFKKTKGNSKSTTHWHVYDDIGKRITLKQDQFLGKDSWEMRCPDTSYRSCLLCATCSNSALYFGKTPLKLMDVLADRPCNICLKQAETDTLTGHTEEIDTNCFSLEIKVVFLVPQAVAATKPHHIPHGNEGTFVFIYAIQVFKTTAFLLTLHTGFPFGNPLFYSRSKSKDQGQRSLQGESALAAAGSLRRGPKHSAGTLSARADELLLYF